VLSSDERRMWDDIERCYAAEIEEPALPGLHRSRLQGRGIDDLPAAVVAALWGSILLVLFGFVPAGFAVGAVTAGAALLWRYWPLLHG